MHKILIKAYISWYDALNFQKMFLSNKFESTGEAMKYF